MLLLESIGARGRVSLLIGGQAASPRIGGVTLVQGSRPLPEQLTRQPLGVVGAVVGSATTVIIAPLS